MKESEDLKARMRSDNTKLSETINANEEAESEYINHDLENKGETINCLQTE